MNTRQLGQILNRLFHSEQSSLIPRMAESTVFISWASNDEALKLRRMVDQERDQLSWLVQLMSDLGESPTHPRPNAWRTSLHFVEIATLLPQVIQDLEQRLTLSTEIGAEVAHHPDASEVVGRIASRHREHLELLQSMQSGLQTQD